MITPVVDYALTRDTVDPKRIALLGVSQGGYWVPRAVAFEKRIAAAVADPGVVDVVDVVDRGAAEGADRPARVRQQGRASTPRWTRACQPAMKAGSCSACGPTAFRPTMTSSTAAATYNLTDVAGQITCPMLITAPDSEVFWPGQSERLYDLIKGPKTLVRFTAEEGADLHCEPKAYGLRDLRIFDWLDETLA